MLSDSSPPPLETFFNSAARKKLITSVESPAELGPSQGFVFFTRDISSKAGRDFNDPLVYGNTKLLHQNKLPIISDGKDSYDSACFATFDVFPAILPFNPKKAAFE
jgi:hypothetical protein